jgi:hypothetical protein
MRSVLTATLAEKWIRAVSIARLTEWRERALAGAATALKERERDDRVRETLLLQLAAQASRSRH